MKMFEQYCVHVLKYILIININMFQMFSIINNILINILHKFWFQSETYFIHNHEKLRKPVFNFEGPQIIWCFVYGAVHLSRLFRTY